MGFALWFLFSSDNSKTATILYLTGIAPIEFLAGSLGSPHFFENGDGQFYSESAQRVLGHILGVFCAPFATLAVEL
jgi:hypothetical protein